MESSLNKKNLSAITYNSLKAMLNTEKPVYPVGIQYLVDDGKKAVFKYTNLQSLGKLKQALGVDNHLFEVLHDTKRKLYFDVDMKQDTPREEVDSFLSEFKNVLEHLLGIEIKPEQFLVLCNDTYRKVDKATYEIESSDKIHSLHIIIDGYKMENTQLMHLVDTINDRYDMFELDNLVYNNNQIFKMVNQSKVDWKIKSIPYNEISDIKKTLIGHHAHCKVLKFSASLRDYYVHQTDEDVDHVIIKKENIMDLIITGKDGETTFDRDKFFNSKDWKKITRVISKIYGLYDMDSWLQQSLDIANNSEYTLEQNKAYVDSLINPKNGIFSLYRILNKYTNNVVSNHIGYRVNVKDWLEKTFDEEQLAYIISKIMKRDKIKVKDAKTPITQNWYKTHDKDGKKMVLNVKTGMYHYEDETYGNGYYKHLPPLKEDMFQFVQDITELKTELVKFLDGNKKVFIGKSAWGTGKTFHIMTTAITHQYNGKDMFRSILLPSESNSNNVKTAEQFGFISHTQEVDKELDDDGKPILIENYPRVVCSVQSLYKLKKSNFDLVIIDEFESVMSAYLGYSTFKGERTPHESFDILVDKIQNANKVIILDADISQDKCSIITDIVGRHEIVSFKNQQKNFTDVDIEIVSDLQEFTNIMTSSIENKNKICVASAVKEKLESLTDKIEDRRIMTISLEGVFIYDGVSTGNKTDRITLDKSDTLRDLEKAINDNDIPDILTYTTTIKTGISVNEELYDELFVIVSSNSINYFEMIQMLFRLRKLKNKKITILMTGYNYKNQNQSYEFIEREQHKQLSKLKQFGDKSDHFTYVKTQVSELYYKLQTINNRNIYNTRTNNCFNFLQVMDYHGLKYRFSSSKTYQQVIDYEIDIFIDSIDAEQAIADKRMLDMMNWIGTPLMDYSKYHKLSLLKDERYDNLTSDEISQYKKSSFVYSLHQVKRAVQTLYIQYFYTDKSTLKKHFSYHGTSNEPIDDLEKQLRIATRSKDEKLMVDIQTQIDTIKLNTTYIDDQIRNTIECIVGSQFFSGDLNKPNEELDDLQQQIKECLIQYYIKYIKNNHSDDVFNIYDLFRIVNGYTQTLTNLDNKVSKHLETELICKLLGCYDNSSKKFIPRTITNSQFKKILKDNHDYIQVMYDTLIPQTTLPFNHTKNQIDMIYRHMKSILKDVAIRMSKTDGNHTSRDSDKISITNKWNNVNDNGNRLISNATIPDEPQPVCLMVVPRVINKEVIYLFKKTKSTSLNLQDYSKDSVFVVKKSDIIKFVYNYNEPDKLDTDLSNDELKEQLKQQRLKALSDKENSLLYKDESYLLRKLSDKKKTTKAEKQAIQQIYILFDNYDEYESPNKKQMNSVSSRIAWNKCLYKNGFINDDDDNDINKYKNKSDINKYIPDKDKLVFNKYKIDKLQHNNNESIKRRVFNALKPKHLRSHCRNVNKVNPATQSITIHYPKYYHNQIVKNKSLTINSLSNNKYSTDDSNRKKQPMFRHITTNKFTKQDDEWIKSNGSTHYYEPYPSVDDCYDTIDFINEQEHKLYTQSNVLNHIVSNRFITTIQQRCYDVSVQQHEFTISEQHKYLGIVC